MHQVSCQGVTEMGRDMFQRYAVRATMIAITTELKECAQGWCWRWRGVMQRFLAPTCRSAFDAHLHHIEPREAKRVGSPRAAIDNGSL